MENKFQIPPLFEKITVEVCRYLLASVFLFSGYVKAVDPLGTVYKNLDYFDALGLTTFNFAAVPFAFFLFSLEFLLGACLLLGVYRKYSTILILLFMLFMTPFTLYIAIADPVTDCGCFGEALLISNWQTFFKNIILLLASFVVFFGWKRMKPLLSHRFEPFALTWNILFVLFFSFYCFLYLPILDFRPYKIGAYLPELMEIPEDAEPDEYKSTLVYSKDGVEKEFTLEDYPRNDDSWTFVDSRSKLIKKGYEPPVHDFVILTEDGEDITDQVLENPSYTFLLIAYDLTKANDSRVDEINEIYDYALEHGYDFYTLTSSLSDDIEKWISLTGAEYPFCTMDEITLKTIVRSNPGLVLMKGGIIVNKWPSRTIPKLSYTDDSLEDSNLGQIPPDHSTKKVFISCLLFLLPLIVLFLCDYFQTRKRKREV